jgi:hypothetical protein
MGHAGGREARGTLWGGGERGGGACSGTSALGRFPLGASKSQNGPRSILIRVKYGLLINHRGEQTVVINVLHHNKEDDKAHAFACTGDWKSRDMALRHSRQTRRLIYLRAIPTFTFGRSAAGLCALALPTLCTIRGK